MVFLENYRSNARLGIISPFLRESPLSLSEVEGELMWNLCVFIAAITIANFMYESLMDNKKWFRAFERSVLQASGVVLYYLIVILQK